MTEKPDFKKMGNDGFANARGWIAEDIARHAYLLGMRRAAEIANRNDCEVCEDEIKAEANEIEEGK